MKKESADFSTNPKKVNAQEPPGVVAFLTGLLKPQEFMTKITSQKGFQGVGSQSHMLHIQQAEPMIRATVDLDSLSVLPAKDVQSKSWKRDVLYRTWNVHCQYCKRESNKAEESKIFHDISVYPLSLLKELVLWNQGKDQKDLNWHHNQRKCCSSCSQSQT